MTYRTNKRIDYESLTISDSQPGGLILPPPKYDLLTKPPYTCYSQSIIDTI